MSRQLSLASRPQNFLQLIGQKKITEAIRGHWASGRVIKAWLFSGPKGVGKTSLSRILSISYQCTHQETFGIPCKECRRDKAKFSIYEINAAKIRGKAEIQEALQGSDYGVLGEGKYKVYILDEAHMMTPEAQNLILDYLEDCPDTTVYILCTTAPQKLLETVRRRCQCYELRELETDEVGVLVERLLKFAKSNLPGDRMTDALNEKQIRSPGLIAQAVEKYCAGLSPEDAAQVEGATSIDTKALCRAVIKGDWPSTADYLKKANTVDMRPIRLGVIGYLRTVLLESPEISDRTKVVSDSLSLLCSLQNAEDIVVAAALGAELYKCCGMFQKFKR